MLNSSLYNSKHKFMLMTGYVDNQVKDKYTDSSDIC